MKRFLLSIGCLALMGVLASCNHKELCYDHEPHAERVEYQMNLHYEYEWEYNVENHVDWQSSWDEAFGVEYDAIRPVQPEGVRIHTYNEEDKTETVRNVGASGASVRFNNEGTYSVLFYNNDTEYIVFQGMESFQSALATTRGVSRSSYTGNSLLERNSEETTVNPPDMLYGAYKKEMYVKRSTQTDTLDVTMHPLVFTYLIRYEISVGAELVALARGALAGMAKGVNLGNGCTSQEDATVMFDCTVEAFGAQALVKSFGIPDYPNPNYSRNSRQYGLNLEVRLKNGTTQQFEFDVTDQIEKQPNGGVVVVKGIGITEQEETGGGGFDIGVEGWGDAIDVPLPL